MQWFGMSMCTVTKDKHLAKIDAVQLGRSYCIIVHSQTGLLRDPWFPLHAASLSMYTPLCNSVVKRWVLTTGSVIYKGGATLCNTALGINLSCNYIRGVHSLTGKPSKRMLACTRCCASLPAAQVLLVGSAKTRVIAGSCCPVL